MTKRRQIVGFIAAAVVSIACATSHAQDSGAPAILRATDVDHVTLSTDTLSRLAAANAEPAIRHLNETKHDDATSQSASIAPAVAKLSAQPDAVQALARHGFTPRAYVSSVATLLQTSIAARVPSGPSRDRLIGNAPVDPANVAFVQTHRAEVAQVFAPNVSAAERARTEQEIARAKKMPPGMLGECTRVATTLVPISALSIRSTSAASPSSVVKLADSTQKLAEGLKQQQPKTDLTDIATELRVHAAERPLDSPKLDAAMADLRGWLDANCNPK